MAERDERKLADAFEAQAMKRLSGEMAPIFVSHGVGLVDRSAEAAERRRVQVLIGRDKADRAVEQDRKMAEMELAEGVFVNLADTVVAPTAEWLAKHETVPFTPKQPDQTARVIRTVRAVKTPIVDRLHRRGKLTDDQRAVCDWYRDQFEAARLNGKFKSSALSLVGNVGGSMPNTMPVTSDLEMGARRAIRAARAAVTPPRLLKLLDAVVLKNLPVSRAWHQSQCPKHNVEGRLREAVQQLVDYCERAGVDLRNASSDSYGD